MIKCHNIPKMYITDILIIGGGITGLTTAYKLKDEKLKIALIDASTIGNGVTSKTTAKINYLQGIIYQKLESSFDLKTSKLYFDSQQEAINILKNIIIENKINCDFKQVDSIIFTNKNSGIKKIKKERKLLEGWNVKVDSVTNNNIKAGIKVSDTYVFNPILYLKGLLAIIQPKIDIYENVLAQEISRKDDKFYVKTNNGIIIADKVIVTCHYPFFLFPTLIPLKTYVKREYVNAAKINHIRDFTAINIDSNLHSIRFYKDYIIYGSNSHRLTNNINYKKNYHKSKKDFIKYFNVEPEYTWMNQDIVSNDNLPFIGEVSNNLYLATAYNAWGMTNSVIASLVITDLIKINKSTYQQLFDPKRNNINIGKKYLIGIMYYLKAYVQALFKRNNPAYIKINNIIYGIYIDKNKQKHIVKLICPHMKCNLIFNEIDKTWDCPCHGSRFDLDGNIIETPAVNEIKKN